MVKAYNDQILEKLDRQEDLLHELKTHVAVIQEKVTRINGSILDHEKRLKETETFMTSAKAKVALVSTMIAGIVAFGTSFLLKKI